MKAAPTPFGLGVVVTYCTAPRCGVSITAGGAAAQLIYVSPTQINFVLPQAATIGDTSAFTVNNNGVITNVTAKVTSVSPGVFAFGNQGLGLAAATCQAVTANTPPVVTFGLPPCAVSDNTTRRFINLYGTGIRNAATGTISLIYGPDSNPTSVTPYSYSAQSTYPGLDQINIELPSTFPKGTTTIKIRYTSGTTTIDSNPVDITVQ